MVRRRGDAGAGRTVEISLPRPTAVLAAVALFVALAGGAYAAVAVPSNSVGTNQLKNGAVTLSKVSAAARRSLRGQRGGKGPKGDTSARHDLVVTVALSPRRRPAGS